MKTHTTLLLPSQFTPEAWASLAMTIAIVCAEGSNFRPHSFGFSAFTILGEPEALTAIMFHSVFAPETPPEVEARELALFETLRSKFVSLYVK